MLGFIDRKGWAARPGELGDSVQFHIERYTNRFDNGSSYRYLCINRYKNKMNENPKQLAVKVALVTGGSRGLGAAIARALADEGADVAVSYVSSAEKAAAVVRANEKKNGLGVRAAGFQADQGEPAQAEGLIKSVIAEPQTASTSAASVALSKDLKNLGWKFVGPTTVYAFMQAVGLINDHVEGCVIRAEVNRARNGFKQPRR